MDDIVKDCGIIDHDELSGRPVGVRELPYDLLAVTVEGTAFFLNAAEHAASTIEPYGVVYMPAGLSHIHDPCVRKNWKAYWILFDGAAARHIYADLLPRVGATQITSGGKLGEFWEAMVGSAIEDEKTRAAYASCMLHNILMEIRLLSQRMSTAPAPPAIDQAIQAMRDNLESPELDFEALAQRCGIGLETLRKQFKQRTGLPLHQYFLRLKIESAKSLLTNLPYNAKDVAVYLGFSDPYYFSRLFKAKTGLSPLNYRKRVMKRVTRMESDDLSSVAP